MSEENKDPGIPKARILKSQTQKSQPPGSKIPKTKIKICGLSRMEDIEAVNEACPDYCGFIINYPPSKRNISVDQLAELKKILRKEMKAVGVFVDAPAESVAKLLNENLIDLAQLHGNEDETYIANLKKLTAKPLIKAVKVSTEEEVKKAFDTVAAPDVIQFMDQVNRIPHRLGTCIRSKISCPVFHHFPCQQHPWKCLSCRYFNKWIRFIIHQHRIILGSVFFDQIAFQDQCLQF